MKNYDTHIGVAVAFFIFLLYVGMTNLSTIPQGFSTLALTTGTNYVSSDPFFNGPVYNLAIVADGSGGSLRGTFTPQDIQSFTGSQAPSNNFDVQVDLANQSCTYTLQTQNSIPVYSYSWGTASCRSCWTGTCGTITFSGCTDRCDGNANACSPIIKAKIGEVYRIDTVTHYDSRVNVALITGNTTYSVALSPTNKQADVAGVMRVNLVGNLMGDQSCPVPSADSVIYRPVDSAILQIKSNAYLSSLTQYAATEPVGSFVDRTQTINAFLGSSGFTSQYCQPWSPDGITTQLRCTPSSPVALPLLKMAIKADVLGVVVPSGTPKINGVTTGLIEPGNTSEVKVVLKNIGNETDSFDVSINGLRQVNTQAKRVTLSSNQEQDVPVLIQGSGIIGNYTAVATSVNSPLKTDSMSFRLMINPFCDKTGDAGKTKVSTEYGCEWVCSNEYTTDVREKSCQQFGTFETRGAYNRWYQSGTINGTAVYSTIPIEGELHCTGIGQYTSLADYMDSVLADTVQQYVPPAKAHAYWLPAPICNYVAEYGYHWDGTQSVFLTASEFDYTAQPSTGQNLAPPTAECPNGYALTTAGCTLIVDVTAEVPIIPAANVSEVPVVVQPGTSLPAQSNTIFFIVGGIILVGVAYYVSRGNKRGKFF